jgi:HK97 family phage major capsid protein
LTFHNPKFEGLELKNDTDADPMEAAAAAILEMKADLAERLKGLEAKSDAADKLAERLAKLEAKANRPGALVQKAEETDTDLEVKAFATYLRTGRVDLETKALTAGASTGSVLVPAAYQASVIQKLVEFSPVRSVASAITMSGSILEMPRLVDEVTPGDVTETGLRPEDEPTFEKIDVRPFEQSVIVPVSRVLLEDSAIDLNSFLSGHLARKFGQKEARAFVVGNGTSEAEGVLTSDEVQELETAAAAIKGDDLIDLFHGVASFYAARGSFLMNRQTMAAVRKLKDSNGQYLWQPALAAGQPATILGRPVLEAPDMPGPAAGNACVVFGDFASGYLIADRVNLEVRVDDLTGFGNGIVKLMARRRVGGRVILGEALAKLKLKAA